MPKFIITVTEEVPSNANNVQRLLNKIPNNYYVERLNIEVSEDPTAKIAQILDNSNKDLE